MRGEARGVAVQRVEEAVTIPIGLVRKAGEEGEVIVLISTVQRHPLTSPTYYNHGQAMIPTSTFKGTSGTN